MNILITEEEIQKKIDALACVLNTQFKGKSVVVVCVLKGAFLFAADLFKRLKLNPRLEFIRVQSYQGTKRMSPPKLILEATEKLNNEIVILLEDIVDSGSTLTFIKDYLKNQGVSEIFSASLLYKPSVNAAIKKEIDWIGFEIDDQFVLGYGMDFDGLHREKQFVFVKD